jgi:hypothetical protein
VKAVVATGARGHRNDTREEFLSEILCSGVKIVGNTIDGACSTHVKIINGYTILVVKPEEKIPLAYIER